MKNLLQEIHRRSMWQVLGIYLGTSWVVLQVVELLVENTGLPQWVMPFTMVLLLIGLPIILATAYLQKGSPLTGSQPESDSEPEFHGADQPGTPGGDSPQSSQPAGVHHFLFTWRNAILGGVFAFSLMFGIAGAYVLVRERAMSPPEAIADEAAPGIAVLPFSVRGEELEIWREGMVDALSVNLDGATEYRTIPSQTVLARWSESVTGDGTPDMDTQLEIARRSGARYALSGTVLAMGADVRLTAEIVDVQTGESAARAQVEGAADEALGLVDALSIEILRQLVSDPNAGSSISLAQVTTSSLEAYRAYLEGESHLRRGDIEAATTAFDRAIEADSTFALAHYRLTLIGGFGSRFGTGSVRESIDKAHQYIDRLPPRQAALVEGEWRRRMGDIEAGIRIQERAVRLYPEDPEAWYQLGETYIHWADNAGISPERAEDAFRRAVALDPQFAPYHWHLIDLAVILGRDSATLAERIDAHDRIAAEGAYSESTNQTLLALAHGDSASYAEAVATIGEMDRIDIVSLGTALRHPRVAAELTLVTQRSIELAPDSWFPAFRARTFGQGQVGAGLEMLPPGMPPAARLNVATFLRLNDLPVPESWLESNLAAVDPDSLEEEPDFYAVYQAVIGGDTAVINRFNAEGQAEADSLLAAAVTVRDSSRARRAQNDVYGSYGIEAYLGGRYEEAAEHIERQMPDVRNLERYLLARSYMELGRWKEAETWFRTLYWQDHSLAYYHLGRVYEELGETEKARQAYEDFAIAFAEADSELQPLVEEARLKMAQLGDFPGSE
jgi:tetratricopeptide (TPR) repeat protein